MKTVFVLIAIAYNGHSSNAVIPTLEFSTMEKCQAAIVEIEKDTNGKSGTAKMRCVKIEK